MSREKGSGKRKSRGIEELMSNMSIDHPRYTKKSSTNEASLRSLQRRFREEVEDFEYRSIIDNEFDTEDDYETRMELIVDRIQLFDKFLTNGLLDVGLSGLLLIQSKRYLAGVINSMFKEACIVEDQSFVTFVLGSKTIPIQGTQYFVDITDVYITIPPSPFEFFCTQVTKDRHTIESNIIGMLERLSSGKHRKNRLQFIVNSSIVGQDQDLVLSLSRMLLSEEHTVSTRIPKMVTQAIVRELENTVPSSFKALTNILPLADIANAIALRSKARNNILSLLNTASIQILQRYHHLINGDDIHTILSAFIEDSPYFIDVLVLLEMPSFLAGIKQKNSTVTLSEAKCNFLVLASIVLCSTQAESFFTDYIVNECKKVLYASSLKQCKEIATSFVDRAKSIYYKADTEMFALIWEDVITKCDSYK